MSQRGTAHESLARDDYAQIFIFIFKYALELLKAKKNAWSALWFCSLYFFLVHAPYIFILHVWFPFIPLDVKHYLKHMSLTRRLRYGYFVTLQYRKIEQKLPEPWQEIIKYIRRKLVFSLLFFFCLNSPYFLLVYKIANLP